MSEQPIILPKTGTHQGRIVDVLEPKQTSKPAVYVVQFKIELEGETQAVFHAMPGYPELVHTFWIARQFWLNQPVEVEIDHAEYNERVYVRCKRVRYTNLEQPR